MLITAVTMTIVLSTVLNGIMAGVFFAFSVAVMPGLDGADAAGARSAMRAINARILNPIFFTAFFGSGILSLICVVLAFWGGSGQVAVLCVAATVAYALGAFLPTVVVNVPMNEALETGEPMEWVDYSRRWTRWNTIRAVSCVAATLLLVVASITWGMHIGLIAR